MRNDKPRHIIIVGAGFGGIACALKLAKYHLPQTRITLINDKTHFEYKPALYRVVTGNSALEVCIPLSEIFANKDIEVVKDTITNIDLKERKLTSASQSIYAYDILVLALGSQALFYDIPGLSSISFGFISIHEALKLKNHLHKMFSGAKTETKTQRVKKLQFTIVGAGASGVEASGELAQYTKKLARKHGISPSFVTIVLIEAAERILPSLPQAISERVERRLRALGVNILKNRTIVKGEVEELCLSDMEMGTQTVIWTAGVQPNSLYRDTYGLLHDKKGRVEVSSFLEAQQAHDVFIVGDGASTEMSGTAQTAIIHGNTVAENIVHKIKKEPLKPYHAHQNALALPVGPGWAAVQVGRLTLFGYPGWILRRVADLRYFTTILGLRKAFTAWRYGGVLNEECETCSKKLLR